MTDEQDRPVDLPDHLLRALDVVREGRQGILHGVERVVAATLQLDDDLCPMGGATPKAMDEHDARLVVAHGLPPCWQDPLMMPPVRSRCSRRPPSGSRRLCSSLVATRGKQ